MRESVVSKLCLVSFSIVFIAIFSLSMTAIAKKTDKFVIMDYDQFDSLCINDNIPRNLALEWNVQETFDEKKNKQVNTYSYTRSDSTLAMITYTVELLDDGYFKVTKTK